MPENVWCPHIANDLCRNVIMMLPQSYTTTHQFYMIVKAMCVLSCTLNDYIVSPGY